VDATLIGVRMPPELLAALDRFVATRDASMTRPEALRVAFREWAVDRGLLVPSPRDEGKRPDELNAGNDG
jgi:hypothetical protein